MAEFTPTTEAATQETIRIIRKPRRSQCFTEPAIQLDLMLIPGDTFTMGSPEDELGRWDDEGPQHQVTVSTFLMGRYPITQAQWRTIATRTDLKVKQDLDPDPSDFKGDAGEASRNENRPVENVSWYEAVEFCDRLSRLTGHTYRLPTEAEWEYACRAGTETPFHFGETTTTALANYRGQDDEDDPGEYPGNYGRGPKGEYRETTTPVNYFDPLANSFGLCDMHGNVWEWCQDHWHDNYEGAPTDGSAWLTEEDEASRVHRGGSWNYRPRNCRSACRYYYPGSRYNIIGFRVVCEVRGL
ncbi:formylglycine-generating enzyme family protein [Egbenema bharatensis]|uniref:formylglycine-generating enzyme family protein n=1 Tax=Egbenema bharatensis TaxID=3463334 RepID=UPI003A86B0FF